jgi:aerobic carbon-monoxide dehydrogenase medium subunit
VIPVAFDYVKATSVADAVSALGQGGEDAKVLSGGQSLLPVLRLRLSAPTLLVDVSRVDAMRGVTRDGDALVIGAATTHHDVMTDAQVRQHAPLLAQAVGTVADPAVRHRGTFGGALSHADPAGDLGSVALALEVELVISGPTGSRTVAAKDFFVDFLETALQPGEILTQIRVPVLGEGWGFHYEKFQRVAQAWSIVGVAAAVHRSNGSIDQARIGLTNMGATPLRAATTETALVGGDASVDAIKAAAAHAADGTSPASDLNGKSDYREHLARVLTARAVATAAGL